MDKFRSLRFLVIMLAIGMLLTTPIAGAADWWDKFGEPQYGGTITRRTTGGAIVLDPDPWNRQMGVDLRIWNEKLHMANWTLDREIFPFTSMWAPPEYITGHLAKGWELPDPQTLVVTIRQGIHWWDKPPVNGREFTAEDVQFNFDRMLGVGSGFTERNPYYAPGLTVVERAVATGKYTVEIRFKKPSALAVDTLFTNATFGMVAREWLEQGELTDWQNVVGTGPWILTDWTPGVSFAYSRNPDYWGYDERHPENQLPYADKFKSVAIDDMTTAIAALRTSKIDMLIERNGPTLQQAQRLAKTDPDIQQGYWLREGLTLALNNSAEPFTDIRVRKAMQMAIDRETIAQVHYMGTVKGTPVGYLHPLLDDWGTPYAQWPKDLQAEYSYDPERAKELLAEANLAGGFKTTLTSSVIFDMELQEILKAQLMEIGIDMEIKTYDMPSFQALQKAGNFEISVTTQTGQTGGPLAFASRTTGGFLNTVFNNDSTFDAMYTELMAATTMDEAKRLSKEMEMYVNRQHWAVNVIPFVNPVVWQSWIKGYSAEAFDLDIGTYYARFWVDPKTKETLGK